MEQSNPESYTTFDGAFQVGIQNYQAKKFDAAKVAFSKALEFEPKNTSAMTDMALVQYQLGEKGWALALLRKAKALGADSSVVKSALTFITPQLEVKEIPHEVRAWETLRSNALEPYSMFSFVTLTALLFFSSGWTLLKYFGTRRRAYENNTASPAFPVFGSLFSILFTIFFALMCLKYVDLQMPRATVVAAKVSALSQPDETAPALFELYSGLEVMYNQTQKDWVQITYPGGPTGWVPKTAVLITSSTAKPN